MASTSDIRKGLCIKYNHDIYKIIEFLHVKPGKGPAFVRTKLKSVTNGKVLDNTIPSGHKIKEVKVVLGGELTKSIKLKGLKVSKAAREQITSKGGEIN